MDEKKILKSDAEHSVVLQNREQLKITGVLDVETFNEEKIIMSTQLGVLIIEGENIHINSLSVDCGEMLVEGDFDSIIYTNETHTGTKTGFWARLFQ